MPPISQTLVEEGSMLSTTGRPEDDDAEVTKFAPPGYILSGGMVVNVTVCGSLRSLTSTGSTATATGRLWMSGIVEATDGAELSAFSISVTESETALVT